MSKKIHNRLENLGEIALLINAVEDIDAILERIVYAVCRHSDWKMSGILKLDPLAGVTRVVKRFDPYSGVKNVSPTTWNLSTSPVSQVVKSRQPLIINDAQNNPDYPAYNEDAVIRGYRTAVIIPLLAQDIEGCEMVLTVQSRKHINVSESELTFLQAVANMAKIAVDKTISLQKEIERGARLRQTVEDYTKIMHPVLKQGAVTDVINELDHIIYQPWLFVDLTENRIYSNRSPLSNVSDREWRLWLDQEGQGLFLSNVRKHVEGTTQPIELEIKFGLIQRLLRIVLQSLIVDEDVVGAICIFVGDEQLDDIAKLQIQAIRLSLSALMMRKLVQFKAETNSQTQVVLSLLKGNWESKTDLTRRARSIGLHLDVPLKLMVIAVVSASKNVFTRTHKLVAKYLERYLKANVVVQSQKLIVALIPSTFEITQRSLVKIKHIEALIHEDCQAQSIITLSKPCHRLQDYHKEKINADRLIQLSKSFGTFGYVSNKDFGAFSLLVSMTDKRLIDEYLDITIKAVCNDDSNQAENYLDTLRAFLDNEGRYQHSADQLGIHVSTLRYRLDKIRDKYHLNLDDAKVRFDYGVALRLYDLVTTLNNDKN